MATQSTQRMSGQMQQCIDECSHCHAHCLGTVQHCLEEGGRHAEANHIRLLLDCAEICQTSANFMIRGSQLHTMTCAVCAETCEQCARDCEQFCDDSMMRACAEACHSCAASCREMAKTAPGGGGCCCG